MVRTSTDEEQIEMLKTFWHEYGKYILIAVVIGLALGYGWQYWKQRQLTRTLEASSMYYEIIVPSDKGILSKEQVGVAKRMISHYPQTPYASIASFILAKQQVSLKKYKEAIPYLTWVVSHSHVNSFKQLARIRKARIEVYLKQPRQALATLKKTDDVGFMPMVQQMRADAYMAQGKRDQANALYTKAKAGYEALGIVNTALSLQ